MENTSLETMIVEKTRVEFVLVGPFMSRDRVLVRSAAADISLIGLATDIELADEFKSPSTPFDVFYPKLGSYHVVESRIYSDVIPEYDRRRSSYRLAWFGHCSSLRKEKIQRVFDRAISEIVEALKTQQKSEMELAIAPVVLSCVMANERGLKLNRLFIQMLFVYGAIGLTALIAVGIQRLLSH